ncbi:MAG: alcohol dehydrogenase catalytic domain-containing protein [Negativicutes bacterium]|nr:alcohol dehydrogenase catalytic domain-containing protein [Negativicutes bacterium]
MDRPDELKLREAAPLPALQANEVKLKVIYGGICGSDLRVYKGLISYAKYPIRPGHEVLGVIVEAGSAVSYPVGTRVAVFPNTFCGTCEFCQSGKTNICKHKQPLGVAIDGVFAQEVVLEAKYVVPVPDAMANERAILIEPFAVTVHALKKANITKGTTVAIVGGGTEGLLSVALALHLGAAVTVIDINPAKLALAKKLGNVAALQPHEVKDQVFDVVVEAAGVKAAIEQAMQLVKPGGAMIALGITGDPVNLYPIHIVRSEITIYGTIIYTLKDFAAAIQYLNDPAFYVDPIVSMIVPYTGYRQAFADALSGKYAKIVLDFQD